MARPSKLGKKLQAPVSGKIVKRYKKARALVGTLANRHKKATKKKVAKKRSPAPRRKGY